MRSDIFKVAIIALIVVSFSAILYSETVYINNRQYEKIDGQWYQIENGYQFELNNSVITVKFKSSISTSQIENYIQENDYEIIRDNILGFYDIEIPEHRDPIEAVQDFIDSELVEVAEPNNFGRFHFNQNEQLTPNDPLFQYQWHHHDEEEGGIDSVYAWEKETGSPDFIIAILDSGVDIEHEDLNIAGVWGNGTSIEHGTAVLGCAGAITNNEIGVAGVAGGWGEENPGCSMYMCSVVLNGTIPPQELKLDTSNLDDAILYAAEDLGARIISMSFWCGSTTAIEEAIEYAYTEAGCFITASSGNESIASPSYPASNEYVFAVGASTKHNPHDPPIEYKRRAGFSNYGEGLMVVAPGVDILTTVPDNSYGWWWGTSFSAPLVAGVAGLVASYHPHFTNKDIERVISITADKEMYADNYGTELEFDIEEEYGTWNEEVGYGKLNADRALGISGIISEDIVLKQGNYFFGDEVIVTENATLTFNQDSRIYLLDNTRLIIEEDATLVISDSVLMMGETRTIPGNEGNPEIPGNRIEIYGNLYVGNDVRFSANEDEYWDGLYLYNHQTVSIEEAEFKNCDIKNYYGELHLNNVSFTSAFVFNENADLIIDNCDFDGSIDDYDEIYIYTINCYNNPSVSISNTDIYNSNSGIQINNGRNYIITNCNIYDNIGTGILINETYDGEVNLIDRTNIYNNEEDGIRFYASVGKVQSSSINNNSRGISAVRGSIVEILKDPESGLWVDDNIISNNENEELYFTDNCTILMDYNRNKIMDSNTENYLVICPNMSVSRAFRYNYWGYTDIYGNAILPPAERFEPPVIDPTPAEIGYMLSPVWDPGSPTAGESLEAEALYREAELALNNNNYTLAEQLFKQVITNYPETQFSRASAKRLIQTTEEYGDLQNYYLTEPNLQYNNEIEKFSDYLANYYCNVHVEFYEDAVYFFEDIISTPPSVIDSIMAVIDIGYTYMLMEQQGDRSDFTGRIAHLKPGSKQEYEENRELMFAELFSQPDPQPQIEDHLTEQTVPDIPRLFGNYPNPFNPQTTISFAIPKDSPVSLTIYNIKGQKVKRLLDEYFEKGEHTINWDSLDDTGRQVSSGVYLFKLMVNEKTVATRKGLLLK